MSEDEQRFVAGVEKYLVPAALREGFSPPAWIPRSAGETLCALRGEAFHLLVYLASGHGINMTVCVAPDFRGAWNPSEELGLTWLCRCLGLADWDGARRYGSYDERDAHLRALADRLPEIVASARARGASLWPELRAFFRKH